MKCPWVENMISIETDGWTRPCCAEPSPDARIAHISNGIIAAWNDPKLLQLRDDLSNGYSNKTTPFCKRCEILESANQPSMRTSTQFITENRTLKTIQFKMSNKCQLTCAHCGPELSTGWKKFLNITPITSDSFKLTDSFLTELGELLPQLTCLKFTGGEPFLDPNHWKILEYLKQFNRNHCTLEYITNGISPFRSELWQGWATVKCSVSADGFEETYEWFRRGSTWNELVNGVNSLKTVSDVSINFAITPYTIHSWNDAKEFWKYDVRPYPIVYPSSSSLFEFPKSLLDIDAPFYTSAAQVGNIKFYQQWAKNWDSKWNTEGWASKIFNWMEK